MKVNWYKHIKDESLIEWVHKIECDQNMDILERDSIITTTDIMIHV